MKFVSSSFPGLSGLKDFTMHEEWYNLKNLAPDMHVILVQDTQSMRQDVYKNQPNYPMTWARRQGKGRVFYTSLGHREDVWTNPLFQRIALAGMNWAAGDVDAEVEPNLERACPGVEHVWADPVHQ